MQSGQKWKLPSLDEPMLMVSKDYMFHDQVLAHCRQAGFTPNITFTTSQWDLLLEMTAENQGVTLIGRPLVEKLYSAGSSASHFKIRSFCGHLA